MISNKLLQKNYTTNRKFYQLKLPLNIEVLIPEDDSLRLLSQFVEGLDYQNYMRLIPE